MILVVVTEVPNDETAAMALGSAMQGNVRTMTMRAFGREEMGKIVGSRVGRSGDARPA